MQRFKLIGCKVFYREISFLTFNSPHFFDVTYLRQGLHDTPDILRKALQDEIDHIDSGDDLHSFERTHKRDFEAILLGYGLCSNAICGVSSKKYRLVIPRAHDCATLFLGSKEEYQRIFEGNCGGIFWYTRGWNESILMPGKERIEKLRAEYIEKYGEDNADYLMEIEQKWIKEYNTCAYIAWNELFDEHDAAFSKACAEWLGWRFEHIAGNSGLFKRFLNGDWNNEEFIIAEPGQQFAQSFDRTILRIP